MSWSIQRSGKASLEDLEDGSISKTIIKPWISTSWSQYGTFLNNFLKEELYTEVEKSCLTQMLAQQSYQTLRSNSTIKKSVIPLSMSVSRSFKITTLSLWSGPLLLGHCHRTWLWQLNHKWITLRSKTTKETKSLF